MYRKNLIAGSCGGIVFTKNKELYHLAMAHADRGKPVWRRDINLNNPGYASFPALNFNTDELSCAVGIASLERLDITIEKRKNFLKYFIKLLTKHSKICTPSSFGDNFSPFFYPVFVNTKDIKISKTEFALELKKRGVGNNEHYGCIISSWEWAKKYFKYGFSTPNAENMRDTSFNLFLNENYNKKNAEEIVDIIVETEKIFMK
jgi:dTDP-4-amino-4,6-dideoxygalactose transaminase